MIATAIYNTIQTIIPVYPLRGDVAQTMPLAVYAESYRPVYHKDGAYAYVGTIFVSVLSQSKIDCRNKSHAIMDALHNMSGAIVDDTHFLHVRISGEINVDYDGEDDAYFSEMTFAFKSKNL